MGSGAIRGIRSSFRAANLLYQGAEERYPVYPVRPTGRTQLQPRAKHFTEKWANAHNRNAKRYREGVYQQVIAVIKDFTRIFSRKKDMSMERRAEKSRKEKELEEVKKAEEDLSEKTGITIERIEKMFSEVKKARD